MELTCVRTWVLKKGRLKGDLLLTDYSTREVRWAWNQVRYTYITTILRYSLLVYKLTCWHWKHLEIKKHQPGNYHAVSTCLVVRIQQNMCKSKISNMLCEYLCACKTNVKATGTCLWIKLICHQLARITSPTNKLSNYFKNQSLKKSLRYSCAPHRLC